MKNISSTAIMALLLVVSWVAFLASSGSAQAVNQQARKWRYTSSNENDGDNVQRLGADGWEPFAVTVSSMAVRVHFRRSE
jgi:hypothetical protein